MGLPIIIYRQKYLVIRIPNIEPERILSSTKMKDIKLIVKIINSKKFLAE